MDATQLLEELKRLDPDGIRKRLAEIQAEEKSLRLLLRAANRSKVAGSAKDKRGGASDSATATLESLSAKLDDLVSMGPAIWRGAHVPAGDNPTLADLAATIELLAEAIELGGRRFLGMTSATRYCDLSADSLRAMVAAGRLTALRPRPGKILFDRHELDSAILASTGTPRRGRGRRRT